MVTDSLPAVSEKRISKSDDEEMDKAQEHAVAKTGLVPAGVALRQGPVQQDSMDLDDQVGARNGALKRKSRNSVSKPVYAEDDSDDEEDAPLVWIPP